MGDGVRGWGGSWGRGKEIEGVEVQVIRNRSGRGSMWKRWRMAGVCE